MTQTIAANVMASTARSYDEVPYIGGAFPETHPNRLATLGTLFGMQPVDPLRCRVLELGCAQGKNLIPMASTAPHSEFIGIDLSAKQIDVGKNWIAQLRLGNIELRQQNILELTSDIGSFDYIIAHGVLSWVPQVVQEKIFDLCQQLLAPQGIAYLSYNTYPGWHFRDILRNQLCFHTRNAVDERQKFQQAEEYLGILQLAAKNHPGIYGDVLQAQIDLLRQSRDYYVFHDFLEEVNSPFYFSQVAASAERRQLQYLADADFSMMLTTGLTPEMLEKLKQVSHNLIETEQYLDFFRNRTFRRSLFCRDDISLQRNVATPRLMTLYVSSNLNTTAPRTELTTRSHISFANGQGSDVKVSHPLCKVALSLLRERFPARLRFDELIREAQTQLLALIPAEQRTPITEDDIHGLGGLLIHLYSHHLVDLHAMPLPCTHTVSDRPVAYPFARLQAAEGIPHSTTCRHDQIQLNGMQRELLSLLDGTRTREQLRQTIAGMIREGKISATEFGSHAVDPRGIETWIAESLELFRVQALLVG